MILSMTGFGKSAITVDNLTIKTEIRTLNSKNLDLTVKLPLAYREKENQVRNLVGNKLERGKVEVIVTVETGSSNTSQTINTELLAFYYTEIKKVTEKLNVQVSDNFIPDLIRLPDVLKPVNDEPDPEQWQHIEASIKDAIHQVVIFRQSEGKHHYEDITAREKKIRHLLETIAPLETARIVSIRDKINRSLRELAEDIKVDQNRFEQEVIFYLEKLDITEEKVRLKKHLDYFDETLASCEAEGKKLGFIAQEIGREINTIGSKANDAEIQKIVVQMKDELEKIKEQLMNIV